MLSELFDTNSGAVGDEPEGESMSADDVSVRKSKLSTAKKALFEEILRSMSAEPAEAPTIPRRKDPASAPLSFAQRRLWFINKIEPSSPAYNFPLTLRLTDRLNVNALEQAINEVIRRHETLRTLFAIVGQQPTQVIKPSLRVALPVVDLEGLFQAGREAEAIRLAAEAGLRAFNLEEGPLIRICLLRLSGQDHILALVIHHIVIDGWSAGVMVQELATLYNSYSSGKPSSLEELPIQYADFATWQRERLQGEALETQLEYWTQALAGAPYMIELITDRRRPPVQSFRGATRFFSLSQSSTELLKTLSQQEGATLFMTLLAAFQAFLHRYTDQQDILVGTPVANRNQSELEGLIGFFVNTLVMRAKFGGELTFRELVVATRDVTLGAYANQDLPFERLVEVLQPDRSLSHNPLVQVMFVLENASYSSPAFPGLNVTSIGTDSGTSKFDLRVTAREIGEGLTGSIAYNTDLFDEPTITRMAALLQTLLESAAATPDRSVSALALMSTAEQVQIVEQWNRTSTQYERVPIHSLIERQAERRADSVAVEDGDRQMSYGELNRRANKLARHLRGKGAREGVIVGMSMEKGFEMVVGIVGILKSGAAYLPLDPDYPSRRLSFMLESAKVPMLLTQEHLADRLPAYWAQVVCLDADWGEIAAQNDQNLTVGVSAENLAYVIYTSGSTGQPKGVMVAHYGLCNLADALMSTFDVCPESHILQFASLSFDASIFEILMALCAGASLRIASRESLLPGPWLNQLLRDYQITHVMFPPSVLTALPVEDLPRLSHIIVGGEACPSELPELWAKGRRFFNAYGPTEATVWATVAECFDGSSKPTIGRPIRNVQVYILDAYLSPVPVGVPGELFIGGAGIAHGYLNMPEMTAERFIPSPFSDQPGARLYKTGDLARYLIDGQIDYLGRVDYQVKLRGFRIELGEVEAAIRQHHGVRDCTVIMREDKPGDKRLVAYAVAKDDASDYLGSRLDVSELRSFLLDQLPEYMVPASFVLLEALPLTANGKIDKQSLPLPEQVRPSLDESYVPPRTDLESLLAMMWQELLDMERIGVEDDFFSLGGDSIKAAIFTNSLQEKLGEIIHVVTIFNSPTVARLAGYLKQNYAAAISKICADEACLIAEIRERSINRAPATRIDSTKAALMRRLIKPLPPRDQGELAGTSKNPPAIFILSPPRSGSTLLRVMLAGHPRLFAPPELELLSFNTLEDRKAAFSGPDSFWLEGAIRAIMAIKGCDAGEAKSIMQGFENQRLSTRQFYGVMQEWIDGRTLVDKTPAYTMSLEVLKRAETDFNNALYIHLLRHPCGMIQSFEEARIDQIFSRYGQPFSTREFAELVWLICHENILEFLKQIPEQRKHRIKFEDLVTDPEAEMRAACDFLELDFHSEMIRPYEDEERKMTGGIHKESRMLGDLKFHNYSNIDPSVGRRWRANLTEEFLGDITRDLAEKLGYMSGRNAGSSTRQTLTRISRASRDKSEFPLSFAQRWLWSLDQLKPGNIAYNIPIAVRLSGALNVPAMEQSFGEIIRRHETLRTSFKTIGGKPAQIIAPHRAFRLPLTDLSGLSETDRESEARRLATEEARHPFDLEAGPLLRVIILKLGRDDHALLISMHHIVSDGWSMGVFISEFAQLYKGFGEGELSLLPELPIQYIDFAVWQQRRLEEQALREELSYWKRQLNGAPATLQLPFDHPRPEFQSYRGANRSLRLSEPLSREIIRLARREGVTLFQTMLSAFKAFIYRHTSQADILIGTSIAGRDRPDIDNLIGYFVNTLVLRTKVSGDLTFRELLSRVQHVTSEAFAHQEAPFEKIVEELQPECSAGYSPLFQVMFRITNTPMPDFQLPGLKLSPVSFEIETAKFDLTFSVVDDEPGILMSFEYNTDLFDVATITRMLVQMEAFLEGIVINPDRRISDLPLPDSTRMRLGA